MKRTLKPCEHYGRDGHTKEMSFDLQPGKPVSWFRSKTTGLLETRIPMVDSEGHAMEEFCLCFTEVKKDLSNCETVDSVMINEKLEEMTPSLN